MSPDAQRWQPREHDRRTRCAWVSDPAVRVEIRSAGCREAREAGNGRCIHIPHGATQRASLQFVSARWASGAVAPPTLGPYGIRLRVYRRSAAGRHSSWQVTGLSCAKNSVWWHRSCRLRH